MRKTCRLLVLFIAWSLLLILCACGDESAITDTPKESNSQIATEKDTVSTEQITEKATVTATDQTTEKATNNPTIASDDTEHIHNWEEIKNTIHHNEVTQDIWIIDEPKSYVNIEVRGYWCQYCSRTWSYSSARDSDSSLQSKLKDMDNHLIDCTKRWKADPYRMEFNYPKINVTVSTETAEIEEKGHYETKTIQEGYDETIIVGQRCSNCGETEIY